MVLCHAGHGVSFESNPKAGLCCELYGHLGATVWRTDQVAASLRTRRVGHRLEEWNRPGCCGCGRRRLERTQEGVDEVGDVFQIDVCCPWGLLTMNIDCDRVEDVMKAS